MASAESEREDSRNFLQLAPVFPRRLRDHWLAGHAAEFAELALDLGQSVSLSPEALIELELAARLHDVGKRAVPASILNKPAALSEAEWSVMRRHPEWGSGMLVDVPGLDAVASAVHAHHERWDGTGYPSRLTGPQIPLEARIVAVADSFSAMTAERPYRARMPVDDACQEIEACAGTQFDPGVVAAFVAAVRRRPPVPREGLAAALDDPEIRQRRGDREPLLGFGSISVTDNVTLLYSHSYFRQVVDAAAKRAEIQGGPFTVVLVELVGLEEENRRSGFAAGDAALSAAGRTLQRVAVLHGGTASRHGGDRLALALPGADLETALRLAHEIVAGLPQALRACAGVAEWQAGESGDDVGARARQALVGQAAALPAGRPG
jgi:diguanylate cyclase (GGDEF)-like protein